MLSPVNKLSYFLRATNIAATDPAWIGDGAFTGTVTGTPATVDPRGFNKITLVGPPGVDLDGLRHDFVSSTLWNVAGHKPQALATTLLPQRATVYSNAVGAKSADVFVTSDPGASVTVSGTSINPIAGVALSGNAAGNFYVHAPTNVTSVTTPFPVTVTASKIGQTTAVQTMNVTDLVNISSATYSLSGKQLSILATSTNGATPILTGVGLKTFAGTLTDPPLTPNVVSGLYSLTIGSVASPLLVVPSAVTVSSSMGGSQTVPVFIIP